MSDIKDTGGPAFPFSFEVEGDHRWAHGMTLRDYIAIKAMQGMLADGENYSAEKLADYSYKMADVMLEARK